MSWINLCVLLMRKRKQIRWINRRWLVSPINKMRIQNGDYDNLFQQIKNDSELFYRYTRMTLVQFQQLVQMTKPYLTKKSSRALIPELRLLITLRYLLIIIFMPRYLVINSYYIININL